MEIDLKVTDAVRLLGRTPKVLRSWLGGLPRAWLRGREDAGSWSPHEIVGHLIHGEETDWVPRLRQMLAGDGDRPFEPFDRAGGFEAIRDRSTDELLDELAVRRSKSLEILTSLELDADTLALPGTHPELGAVTVRQLLATWVAHDQTHIAQIARVMAKQYRSEVGPWRAYLPLLDRPRGTESGLHQGLYEAHLPVTDVARSADFYRDVLDFDVGFGRKDDDSSVLLHHWNGGTRWMLGLFRVDGIEHRHPAEYHLAFRVPRESVDGMVQGLKSRGVEPTHPPGAPVQGPMEEPIVHGWMPAASVFFRDPDGHLLELIAELGQEPRPGFQYGRLSEWRALVRGEGA